MPNSTAFLQIHALSSIPPLREPIAYPFFYGIQRKMQIIDILIGIADDIKHPHNWPNQISSHGVGYFQ